jgi:RHS repeat-associated protein
MVSGGYRFGYQGYEAENEVNGNGNSYTTEFRQLDPRLGRWLSVDLLAMKFPSISPYVFCNDNPVYFVDSDGRAPQDWFLNQKTGKLIYIKGESEITQDFLNKIKSPFSVSDYKRVGNDYMFGKSLPVSLPKFDGTNQLDKDFLVVHQDFTEILMEYVGLEKAQEVNIVEKRFVSGGSMGAGEDITSTNYSIQEVGVTKIDYVKPSELNKKRDLKKNEYYGRYSSITSVEYTLTKPYGQKNSETSYFEYQKTYDNVKTGAGAAEVVYDLIKSFFK